MFSDRAQHILLNAIVSNRILFDLDIILLKTLCNKIFLVYENLRLPRILRVVFHFYTNVIIGIENGGEYAACTDLRLLFLQKHVQICFSKHTLLKKIVTSRTILTFNLEY